MVCELYFLKKQSKMNITLHTYIRFQFELLFLTTSTSGVLGTNLLRNAIFMSPAA